MKTTKQLVKFDFDIAVITALDTKYKDIQITDGKSYAVVMQGLAEYRELRLAIDDKHKELKADILEAGRSLDGDKNRLKALLEPGEDHLKKIRQVEDDRKAKIKEEKARLERERIEAIQGKIDNIRHLGIMLPNVSALVIEERLIIVKAMKLPGDVEFTGQAEMAQKTAIANLEQALTERIQFEKEEVERKAEAEHLEAQRKEQEAAQAKIDEAEKRAAKRQAENDARMAAEQAKIDEENKKIEAQKYNIAQEIKAEDARKEKEAFEKTAKENAEAAAAQKVLDMVREADEKKAAEVKEKARQEALRPDKEKLIKFADQLYDIECPVLKSTKAQKISSEARDKLGELAQDIRAKAKKL